MPECAQGLWNNVFILVSDEDSSVSSICTNYIQTPDVKAKVGDMCNYKNTLYDLRKSLVQRKIGEDVKCNYTAKKAAASFIFTQFKEEELRTLLPKLIELMSTCIRLDIEIRKETAEDLILLGTCKNMCHWISDSHNWFQLMNVFGGLFDVCNTIDEISSVRSAGLIKCMNEVLYHLSSTPQGQLKLKPSVMTITSRYIGLLNILPKTVETAVLEHTCGVITSPPVKLIENPKYIQANAVHNSCLLEGLGILVKLNPEYVTPECLSRILEYAGIKDMEYTMVARTAIKTLESMTAETGQTMNEYLSENLDLIMSDIGVRVSDMTAYPHTADALVFLADYFDFSQSTFVSFVEQVFYQCNHSYYEKESQEMFCRIFYAFILSLWKYYYEVKPSQKMETPISAPKNFGGTKPAKTLAERLLDHQKLMRMKVMGSRDYTETTDTEVPKAFGSTDLHEQLEKLEISEDDPTSTNCTSAQEDIDSDDDPDPVLDPSVKPEISMAARIANTVISNLPQPARSIRLISMDILIKCVQVLQVHENTLLPLTHHIWQNLVARYLFYFTKYKTFFKSKVR